MIQEFESYRALWALLILGISTLVWLPFFAWRFLSEMRLGTRSLLFGVHQFVWHPVTVYAAWCVLYDKRPTWREAVCILIHDWGYWGCADMDGRAGKAHPFVGARIAGWLFGWEYYQLVLFHSRSLARNLGKEPSKLCWADKFSMIYDPRRFYLFRARLSGEIKEYRANAANTDFVPVTASDEFWHKKIVSKLAEMSREKAREFKPLAA